MENGLIEKYLLNKEKTLLSYATVLHNAYDMNDEGLWSNEEEFAQLMQKIIRVYMIKYYLRDNKDINSFNTNNLEEKEFKMTMALSVISDYFNDKYDEYKNKYKKSIYNLALILYIITTADKKISFYNKYNITVYNILSLLEKLFKDVMDDIDIEKNPYLMESLANKIADAEKKELRFFESLKDNESYISFLEYDKSHFYVNYNYDLYSLMKHDNNQVKYVYQKYHFKERYMNIMYELTAITILKCFSNDCNVPKMLVPISSKYLKAKNNLNNVKRIFSNPYIKSRVYFSVYYSDFKSSFSEYLKIRNLGFEIVLFLDESEIIVDYGNLKYDFQFYVTKGFIEHNPKFLKFAQTGKVKYKIIENTKNINEDELIESCLREEN